MKIKNKVFLVILGVLVTISFGSWLLASEKKDACTLQLRIDRAGDPWKDMTAVRSGDPIEAGKLDKTFIFPEDLKKYMIGAQPLLGAGRDKKVLVNNKFFTRLTRVDATRISKDEVKVIGNYLERSFSSTSAKTIAKFLLESQIIETFWHLEARLCLYREDDGKKEYVAYYHGVHSYCTNECLDKKFDFAIRVNKETGELSIFGL